MNPLIRCSRAGVVAAAVLAALSSCALLPFVPDLGARAPALEGFGRLDRPISTRVDGARHWFNQGMLQAYAFNEVEAVRAFKAALAQDAACAMCAWGVAWQLGPNINATERGDLTEALRYVGLAQRNASGATLRERALIDALALRYGHASQAREAAPLMADVCGKGGGEDAGPHPLDIAYAERMRTLADADPQDADVLSIYAEAEMIATPDDIWWNEATGQPVGRIGEVTDRLERLLAQQPEHTGLNHYMIHAADALPAARRAVVAADRLGGLAPRSPHLVHMPAHIYAHVGRYDDATQVNQRAVAADLDLADAQKAQGFSVSKDWRGHNLHFMWFAALMEGRDDVALSAARERATRAAKSDHEYAEYLRSLPMVSLVRFERWNDVLNEPLPSGSNGVAQALGEQARGTAQARIGQLAAAQESLARVQSAVAAGKRSHASKSSLDKMVRAMLDAAEGSLQAELALAQQRYDDAIGHQARVIAAATSLDAQEPPMLAAGSRLALGHIQSRAGRWSDAERSYRQGLVEQPGSGWALRGLVQALEAQGRKADAAELRVKLDRSWSRASPVLRAAI